MVNPRLAFEQTWNTRCCIPTFKVIGCLVPENIFFMVVIIYGHGLDLSSLSEWQSETLNFVVIELIEIIRLLLT